MKKQPPKAQSTTTSSATGTESAEVAYQGLEPALLALPSDRLAAVNVDIQVAAMTALSVARRVQKDEALHKRFIALAGIGEIDIVKLDRLESASLATWHARHMYLLATATRTEAQLPVSLVTTATTLKTRMLRVAEYHLGDHDVAGPIVAAIRAGTGYLDLANDLIALARVYADYQSVLEHDKKDYKPTDQLRH